LSLKTPVIPQKTQPAASQSRPFERARCSRRPTFEMMAIETGATYGAAFEITCREEDRWTCREISAMP
jgi:hypothetical protein